MNEKTKEKGHAWTSEHGNEAAPHPLDRWLKRELQVLYGDPASEPLPADIAELAEKLEKKLKRPGDRGDKPECD